ncbi:MAG: choice-of-anchor J domain-containing protein [Paludibacteraceae bacterium]|nr:choice-of-anchor J domain-containing protein [Paludibacteraceae bacterium]
MKKYFTLLFVFCMFLSVNAIQTNVAASTCQNLAYNESFAADLGEFTAYDNGGTASWYVNTTYACAVINGYNNGTNEDWLVSPAFDLSDMRSATIAFNHACAFGSGAWSERCKLKISSDFAGDVHTATWTDLEMTFAESGTKWSWVNNTIAVPDAFLGQANVRIAFYYDNTDSDVPGWEVKNFSLTSVCNESEPGTGLLLPVALPSIGEPDLVVLAQNVRNYFIHYTEADRSDCGDEACLVSKTNRMVDVFRFANADIIALCELEANEVPLQVITDSLNGRTEDSPYAYVTDGIVDNGYTFIKSGFIYRKDKVKPIGANNASTSQTYYKYTMRYQMFEDLTSGGRFTLSMNHFKAKDTTEDQGNAKRVSEATDLKNKMQSITADPDILILGDLNCEMGEEPLQILVDAGYEEQLLIYNPAAFSHCYGGGELIDHVFANSTMATQITGAAVYHICTSCGDNAAYNSAYRYSDHDPYLVGLKLNAESGEEETTECETMSYSETFYSSLGEFNSINVSGTSDWYCDANYHYAKMNGTASDNNEDWLVSPAFNLSKHQAATLTFEHTANKGTAANKTTMQTLWLSNDYEGGAPASATWTQVTIPNYPTGTNWTFVKSGNINIPKEFLTKNMHFAFKYVAATAAEGSCWEIKNVLLNADCVSGIDEAPMSQTRIYSCNGRIYGADDMRIYNVLGIDVTAQNGSLNGVYIVIVGNETHKVIVK